MKSPPASTWCPGLFSTAGLPAIISLVAMLGGVRTLAAEAEAPAELPALTLSARPSLPLANLHSTFVIVHGAFTGGWAFRAVDRLLAADGNKVYRPTLTGQGEKVHLASREVDLTTHINDIVNVILFEDLHDIVLVGHSYGGMVITGVMNRIPDRIRQVIFLDAAVPDDGQSMAVLQGRVITAEQKASGYIRPTGLKPDAPLPHDVPQPLKTYTEPVSFDNPAAKKIPATYVAFLHDGETLEQRLKNPSARHAQERGWSILTLASDHHAQWSHPRELAQLLEEIAAAGQ